MGAQGPTSAKGEIGSTDPQGPPGPSGGSRKISIKIMIMAKSSHQKLKRRFEVAGHMANNS